MYCSYTKEYAKDQELDTKAAYRMVDEIADFGSPWFGISGGEPLVRDDIFDVIKYAKEKYGMEVSLITSGFAFDQKRLDNLAKYEVHTAVSLDGNRESNDIIQTQGQLRQSSLCNEETVRKRSFRLLGHNHDQIQH